MNLRVASAAVLALVSSAGCLSVKTENEIKPIHITMDINLRVDRELDRAFPDEGVSGRGQIGEVRKLLDRQVAGVTREAMLEPRKGATDDDRIAITEMNMRRRRRFDEIARSSGVSPESVRMRSYRRLDERIPTGSGVWIQSPDGTWKQK